MFALKYYVPITVSYGVVRKTFQVKDATIKRNDKQRIPMLLTDKIFLVASSALFSIYGWPLFLIQDMKQVEIKLRSLEPEWYNISEKNYVADYLFS